MAIAYRDEPAVPALIVRGVRASFGALPVLDLIDLVVEPGEFVALVGPSGCGKSTLLNIIAGLLDPVEGHILLDGHVVHERLGRFAYMPQRDALLPWRSVIDNAILAAEVAGDDLSVARRRAADLLPSFGLEGFGDSLPATLSGGMRQRAAFLRTVLANRPILLLDEPFGALDALTRRTMQAWLLDLWATLGTSVLMVTHDVEEALLLADRVAVMSARPGRIKRAERVALPRPRRAEMIADPSFVSQKLGLLNELHAEIVTAGPRPARSVGGVS